MSDTPEPPPAPGPDATDEERAAWREYISERIRRVPVPTAMGFDATGIAEAAERMKAASELSAEATRRFTEHVKRLEAEREA